MDYRESHLQPGKGQSYHATFSDDPYRNMVWQFEKSILDRILTVFYKDSKDIHYFDFACGTGRILLYLVDRAKSSVGVDLSSSMLEVVRSSCRTVEIIEADLTRRDVLGDRKFNLITAFRFFPNAEEELRVEAMQVLTKHLCDDGYLIFNNHLNLGSTKNRLARFFRRGGYRGMSIMEVKILLEINQLEVVKVFPLCVFPASERHRLLPLFLLRPIEAILSKCRPFQYFGENLIYVCRRSENSLGVE